MGGIIPLLLIVGAIFLMGTLRKKNVTTSEPGEYTPEPSPWDELLRELNQAKQQDNETDESVTMTASDEEPPFVQAPVYEFERPYSYEDDVVDELLGAQETVSLAMTAKAVSPMMAVSEVSPISDLTSLPALADPTTPPATSTKPRAVDLFAQGFDPRMAVVYAEVFKPKYLEY